MEEVFQQCASQLWLLGLIQDLWRSIGNFTFNMNWRQSPRKVPAPFPPLATCASEPSSCHQQQRMKMKTGFFREAATDLPNGCGVATSTPGATEPPPRGSWPFLTEVGWICFIQRQCYSPLSIFGVVRVNIPRWQKIRRADFTAFPCVKNAVLSIIAGRCLYFC